MRYIYITIAVILIAVLTFCTSEKSTVNETVHQSAVTKCLSEQAVFNTDSINEALLIVNALQKDEARKLFLRALDLLVNNKKPEESIMLFKESACYFPDARTYYFLTKAYIEIQDPYQAESANRAVGMLGYDPYYEVAFNDAVIAALKRDTTACIAQLNEAIFEGFLNKKRIDDEKAFDFIREEPQFVALLVNTFNDDAHLKVLVFKNYLKSIPDLKLPYNEPIDSVRNHGTENYISYDYAVFVPEMEGGRFSRDVTNEYLYVGKLKLQDNNFAVIYKSYSVIADTLNPVKTYVITYDSTGTVVDNEMIGCFCSPMNSVAYSVSENNVIESTGYNYTWKFNPLDKGYAGNQVTSFETEKPRYFELGNSGIIIRERVAVKEAPKDN